jgi:hypothetical protein
VSWDEFVPLSSHGPLDDQLRNVIVAGQIECPRQDTQNMGTALTAVCSLFRSPLTCDDSRQLRKTVGSATLVPRAYATWADAAEMLVLSHRK